MTRTGLAPDLCRHAPEPFVELHPEDAAALGLSEGALARIETARATAVVVARLTDRQRRGSAFVPMHWTDAFAPQGRSNPLIGDARDPTSGQPEFKHTPARIRPYRETWSGFFIARGAFTPPQGFDLIWRRTPVTGGQLHEVAGRGDAHEREALRRALTRGGKGERLVAEDPAAGMTREAFIDQARLERVLFMSSGRKLPPRDWLVSLFEQETLDVAARAALLLGRPATPAADLGPMVCACLRVPQGTIAKAIGEGAGTLEAVGAATGAGTNCGSCRIEITRLLAGAVKPRPVEARHAA